MKKQKIFIKCIAATITAVVTSANCNIPVFAENDSKSFKQVIEFENSNSFSSNDGNVIRNDQFNGYSGDGYVYLSSGWGEVKFSVPDEGKYKITVVTSSDQHKQNWLYLDNNSAGQILTEPGKWNTTTKEFTLSKGEHKFGVSSDWGYVALDYVIVESVENDTSDPTPNPGPSTTIPDVSNEKVICQFEDAKSFSSDSGNKIGNDQFSEYSGNGYVYLTSGWAETKFNIKEAGKYKIKLASNSDQYKENWLYLDSQSMGTLKTEANKWNEHELELNLSAGEHKFGVSSNWGYVALDYVSIEKVTSPGPVDPVGPIDPVDPVDPTDPVGPVDPVSKGTMYIEGTKLKDGKGNDFVMRGINIAHAWYTDKTKTSIDAVADLGANCVRVVLADGTQWDKTSVNEVKNIIKWCKDKGLVCILEVHDHTGFDEPSRLDTAVNYWLEITDLLNTNKDYVIVNIANEWLGTWNKGNVWTDTYCNAIKKLRNAGLQNVIMVDAAGYGQETSTLIQNCQTVKNADSTGNTMFSIHMYSVAGKNAETVKNNIDSMLGKGVCTAIGEFGDFQNGGDVDEQTIINYSHQKQMGTIAWSWKGNGGQDMSLDLSKDWEGKNLTQWGKYVFYGENGIYNTSKLAYSLKTPNDPNHPVDPVDPVDPVYPVDPVNPPIDVDTDIKPGLLKNSNSDWFVSENGAGTVSTANTSEKLKNGGYRVNFDLKTEDYPTLMTLTKSLDLSKNKTVNVVIRNNNSSDLQLQPIFKVGSEYKWTEYDQYQAVPAKSTVQLSFDMSKCAERNDVRGLLFRVQGAGSKIAGSVDIYAVDFDLAANAYKGAIAELNRPKSASFFNWAYPEVSWIDQTTSAKCDKDGVITIDYKGVTADKASGIQTETKPGFGKGIDFTPYKTLTCSITNNSKTDISASLLVRTSGGWTWQENGGIIENSAESDITPAGKTVKVTFNLSEPVWKSAKSNWQYTGKIIDGDDVRAFGFKLWSNSTSGTQGQVKISNVEFKF